MSGPKTGRYRVSAAQRLILQEQRRREAEQRRIQQEINRNISLLKQNRVQLKEAIALFDDELAQFERIIAEMQDNSYIADDVKKIKEDAIAILNKSEEIGDKNGLVAIKSVNGEVQAVKHRLWEQEKELSKRLKSADRVLRENISATINEGFNISFNNSVIEEATTDIKDIIHKINTSLDSISTDDLSEVLKEKFHRLKKKAMEIDSTDFIENYYAMSIVPFVKECKAYQTEYQEYGATFYGLYEEYKFLTNELNIPSDTMAFSMEAIGLLTEKNKEMQQELQEKEEQAYISQCIDVAMKEMGYKLIGEKEIVKKNGRRFNKELFWFDEGTAVNVTYSNDGQITMELGGLDDIDRIPTEEESKSLENDMISFCDDYARIEKRLREMGVIVNRLSILPPESQYAQIINTADYQMKEKAGKYEVKRAQKSNIVQQQLRKEV